MVANEIEFLKGKKQSCMNYAPKLADPSYVDKLFNNIDFKRA